MIERAIGVPLTCAASGHQQDERAISNADDQASRTDHPCPDTIFQTAGAEL